MPRTGRAASDPPDATSSLKQLVPLPAGGGAERKSRMDSAALRGLNERNCAQPPPPAADVRVVPTRRSYSGGFLRYGDRRLADVRIATHGTPGLIPVILTWTTRKTGRSGSRPGQGTRRPGAGDRSGDTWRCSRVETYEGPPAGIRRTGQGVACRHNRHRDSSSDSPGQRSARCNVLIGTTRPVASRRRG